MRTHHNGNIENWKWRSQKMTENEISESEKPKKVVDQRFQCEMTWYTGHCFCCYDIQFSARKKKTMIVSYNVYGALNLNRIIFFFFGCWNFNRSKFSKEWIVIMWIKTFFFSGFHYMASSTRPGHSTDDKIMFRRLIGILIFYWF